MVKTTESTKNYFLALIEGVVEDYDNTDYVVNQIMDIVSAYFFYKMYNGKNWKDPSVMTFQSVLESAKNEGVHFPRGVMKTLVEYPIMNFGELASLQAQIDEYTHEKHKNIFRRNRQEFTEYVHKRQRQCED